MKSERCSHFPGYRKTSGQTAACAEGKMMRRGILGCGFFLCPIPWGRCPSAHWEGEKISSSAEDAEGFAPCSTAFRKRRTKTLEGVVFCHFIFSTGWRSAAEDSGAQRKKSPFAAQVCQSKLKASLKPNHGRTILKRAVLPWFGLRAVLQRSLFCCYLFLDGRAGQPLAAQVIQRHLMEF